MTGILALTDGTTRINLLTGIDGFTLQNWTPTIPPTNKVWRESPLSDGRQLAMSKWANATETMTFVVSRFTQNDVIGDIQDLRRLLLAAREYFTGVNTTPVWIEARGACETNTRYAVVCDWDARNDADPYSKPFAFSKSGVDGFVLSLERQHWRHLPPGQSECVELSATQAYYDASDGVYVPLLSADDCYVEHNAGVITMATAYLWFGAGGAPATYSSGIRFRSVAIPQGAIVLNAYVEFDADVANANDNCNVTISGDDVDSSAVFSTYADFMGRARTTANAPWNAIPHWVVGTHYQTPDISAVLNEVVGRAGWVSGNPLGILIDNNGSTAGAGRNPVSWDHAAARYEPHLYAWWYDTTTRTFGRTATCNNEVYVANKHNMAQLTHVYHHDNSTGVYSANLIGAALPVALLPAAPAVNDAVYFGIATGIANSGPFCSLVFDILAAQVDLTTVTWQYWNGGAWVALAANVHDNTNADGAMTGHAFDTTGVNSVHWWQPAAWATTAVNGITGYWVRALVGAVGAGPTPPTQQNRDIYTIVTPFVDATASTVVGDIMALAKQYLHAQSGALSTGGVNYLSPTIAIASLRTYERGSLFTPYLNTSDVQNQAGVTVAVNAGAVATFEADATSLAGRCVDWTVGAGGFTGYLATVTMTSALAQHYIGEYRMFLRLKVNSGTLTDLRFKVGIATYPPSELWQTPYKLTTTSLQWMLVDLGKVTLPPVQTDLLQTFNGLTFTIYGATSAAASVHLSDIILMPCDECILDASAIPPYGSTVVDDTSMLGEYHGNRRFDADSTIPRRMIKTSLEDETTGNLLTNWAAHISGPLVWQPNEHQRWWYLFNSLDPGGEGGHPEDAISVQAWQVSRYLSMRGAR